MDIAKVREVAEQALDGTDMYIVECTTGAENDVTVVVDSDTHVTIDACAMINRAVDAAFDRDVEDYSLTVASAGIGEPLKVLRQYAKLVGSSVEVLLVSGTKILATLDAATDEGVVLSYDEKVAVEGKKRKELQHVVRAHAFAEIKWVKEYLDYK